MNRMKIGYLSTAYHTSFILIGTDWIEKRMNIEAKWTLFPTGPAMIKAFEKGKVNIGYIGLPPAMIGIDRGLPLKCVAGGHMEGTIFTAAKHFKTAKEVGNLRETLGQFKGKTIGTPTRGSIHDVILRNLLDNLGLGDDIAVKNFEWADQILDAMQDGLVEGGVGTPPLAVLASRLLDAKVILPPSMMWPNNPSYGIIATVEMTRSFSPELQDFLRLHEEACNLIRTDPRKAAQIAARTIGMIDEDVIMEVYRVSPKYCASLPKEYIESTLAFVPFLQKMGYMSKALRSDDVFDPSLVQKILDRPHYDDPGQLRT